MESPDKISRNITNSIRTNIIQHNVVLYVSLTSGVYFEILDVEKTFFFLNHYNS